MAKKDTTGSRLEAREGTTQQAKMVVSGDKRPFHLPSLGKGSANGEDIPKLDNHFKQALLKVFGAAIIIIVVAIGARWLHVGQKVYGQAAGHKIYKQDIKDLIGTNKGINDHQAAQVLADKYLSEKLAKERDVTLTDKDYMSEFGPDIKSQKANKFGYQNGLNRLYFRKVTSSLRGIYSGQVLVAHFSRYVPYQSAELPEIKKENPNIGNTQLIAQDKKYAQDFITNLYNQIKAGEITFDQAIELEHQDPKIGINGYQTLGHSGSFDDSFFPSNLLVRPDDFSEVRNLKPGEVSKPFIVKGSGSADGKIKVESYFLIVKLKSKTKGIKGDTDPQQYLNDAKKRLGYKLYV